MRTYDFMLEQWLEETHTGSTPGSVAPAAPARIVGGFATSKTHTVFHSVASPSPAPTGGGHPDEDLVLSR